MASEGTPAGGGAVRVDSAGGGYFASMEGVHEMVAWVKERIRVAGYNPSMWDTEKHGPIVSEFLFRPNTTRLLAFVAKSDMTSLVLQTDSSAATAAATGAPSGASTADAADAAAAVGKPAGSRMPAPSVAFEFQYFCRGPSVALTPSTIGEDVTFGVCGPAGMESLLRVMSTMYVPHVSNDQTLPAGVRRSLTDQMHRFMASLTEVVFQAHGKTVLYLPKETVDLEDLESVKKDKELMQRLESTVIRWTRQIKEVVNQKDNSQDAETATPLDEIRFWESRTLDLSGIRSQLEQPQVKRIADVLRSSKSTYLKSFEELSIIILKGSKEAEDNLKFLSTLEPCCKELEEATPAELQEILPRLLNMVRMVWNLSAHYNKPASLIGLLRKVSNQIMARCCASIPLEGVFGSARSAAAAETADDDGDEILSPVDASLRALRQSVECGEAWRTAYRNTQRLQNESAANPGSRREPWDLKESSIFAQIDAFVQRCKDLEEVCDGKIQFSRQGQGPLPVFGGMQGPSISRAILGIGKNFEQYMAALRSVRYDVLDVKETAWHLDFNTFKSGVKDLEVMMNNTMSGAFDNLETVGACVDMLRCFENLTKKEAVRKALEKKTEATLAMFHVSLKFSALFKIVAFELA